MCRYLLAFSLMASCVSAQEQCTAYDALKIVSTQFHRAALNRIISVTGVDGDPQPVQWTIVIADRNAPAGIRELQVAEGRIISNQTPTSGVDGKSASATIKTSQLNLDSSGAFSVASYTADQSHTNFDLVNYKLRTNDRGVPVWIVTIQDQSRRPLGTIHISANRGNVTRVEGMYHGRDMTQVVQDSPEQRGAIADNPPTVNDHAGVDAGPDPESTDEDDNVVTKNIKQMFYRTKRDAVRLFKRAERSFDDFIDRH